MPYSRLLFMLIDQGGDGVFNDAACGVVGLENFLYLGVVALACLIAESV